MRFLGYLVFAVLALLAVAVGAAYLLPREVTVAREIVIDAPPDRIFPYLNSLHKAKEWSPWTGLDPKAKIEVNYAGPDSGVGSRMTWSSDDPRIGTGSQEIMASVPDQRVETALSFDDMGVSTSWLVLKPEGSGTRVTWGLQVDTGTSPDGRYKGLMIDRSVGPVFEKGLANLKATVETAQAGVLE